MPARILIIEDDAASLELASYLVSSAGHHVTTAGDGQEGLEKALRNEHDLILCDLQLPHLSGYDVLTRLKGDVRWRTIAIVAVTAYSMPGDRAAAISAGFSGYFTKPIDPETFMDELDAFLPDDLRKG